MFQTLRFNTFQNAITFLSLGLLSVILIGSLVTVNIVFKQSAENQIRHDLTVAKKIFSRLLDVQTQRLSDNAYLLSSDFGFKQVIATKDQQTILSALDNLLSRIGADTAILVSLQQQVLADTSHPDKTGQFFAPELIEQAQRQGTANSIVIMDGIPHQMVVTPIMAPDIKAWFCVSFKINQIQIDELMQLTQAHISLLLVQHNKTPLLINSSLTENSKNALLKSLTDFNWRNKRPFSVELENSQYITSILNLFGTPDATIIAVLQKSLDKELAPFYRLQWFLLALTLLSLTLAFIGSLLVGRSISHPIKTLLTGVREVGKGNYDYRIEVVRSDEIGELGSAYNEMVTSYQQQESLRLAKESAENANQAKTDFLANMSHELRSPLNSILGYAQLLQKQHAHTDQQMKALRTIEQSGKHLLALINEILDLSKIEAGQLQIQSSDFDLCALLHDLSNMMQTRAEIKGLTLFSKFDINSILWINSDPQRLRQILMNLLDNAIKYTERGQINFKVSCDINGNYCFSIEDTGIGIPAENLQDIFTSFHQLHQTQSYVEGTGLGLAISERLVQLLGGKLKVSSTAKGSQFWFELHLKEIQAINNTDETLTAPVSNILANQQKILIADDQAYNRALLHDMLSPLGFELAEVSNGQDCIQQSIAWKPDIILLDSKMPIMDGLEVCRQIRSNPALMHIVIIAISANVFDRHRQQCIDAGANDFLSKPFKLEELSSLLNQYTVLPAADSENQSATVKTKLSVDSTILQYPEKDLLQRLLVFAQQGDIQNIRQLNVEISQLHPEYAFFSQQLSSLADDFKINKIRQLLTQALNETQNS